MKVKELNDLNKLFESALEFEKELIAEKSRLIKKIEPFENTNDKNKMEGIMRLIHEYDKLDRQILAVNEGLAFATDEFHSGEKYDNFSRYKKKTDIKLIILMKNQLLRLIAYGGPDFAKNFIVKKIEDAVSKNNLNIVEFITYEIDKLLGKDYSQHGKVMQRVEELKDKVTGKDTGGSIENSFKRFDEEIK